jgi:hypothetical protein
MDYTGWSLNSRPNSRIRDCISYGDNVRLREMSYQPAPVMYAQFQICAPRVLPSYPDADVQLECDFSHFHPNDEEFTNLRFTR